MTSSTVFIVFAVLSVAVFQQASALKCWRCNSDTTSAAYCGDPFDVTILNEQQRRWSYVDCTPPNPINPFQPTQTRPVCKKLKQRVYDKIVVSRSCFWEDITTPPDTCRRAATPPSIHTEFCETCSTDGCNGASAFGASLLLPVAAATIIYKIIKS